MARNFLNGKKGLSHVEVIISFLIFISFVLFLFFVLNPTKHIQASPNIDNIISKFNEKTAVQLDEITLKGNTAGCVVVPLSFTNVNPPAKVIAKKSSGLKIDAKSDSGNIYVQGGDTFYKILSSSAFSESTFSTIGCVPLNPADYNFGLHITRNITSLAQLASFEAMYDVSYAQVKSSLGIGNNFEFAFKVFKDGSEVISATQRRVIRTGIFIKHVPIIIAESNGELKTASLRIELW